MKVLKSLKILILPIIVLLLGTFVAQADSSVNQEQLRNVFRAFNDEVHNCPNAPNQIGRSICKLEFSNYGTSVSTVCEDDGEQLRMTEYNFEKDFSYIEQEPLSGLLWTTYTVIDMTNQENSPFEEVRTAAGTMPENIPDILRICSGASCRLFINTQPNQAICMANAYKKTLDVIFANNQRNLEVEYKKNENSVLVPNWYSAMSECQRDPVSGAPEIDFEQYINQVRKTMIEVSRTADCIIKFEYVETIKKYEDRYAVVQITFASAATRKLELISYKMPY
jgi:hypothetical protein